jgi:hypothetical protein
MEVRPAKRGDLVGIGSIAQSSVWGAWGNLLRPDTLASVLASDYGPGALKRRLLRGGLAVAFGDRSGPVAFAEFEEEGGQVVVHIHAAHRSAEPAGAEVAALLAWVRGRFPGKPVCVDVLLGDIEDERSCEEAGLVPGEVVQRSVHGEAVVARRWWQPLPN